MQSKIFRAHQSLDIYLKRAEKGLKDEDEEPGSTDADAAASPGGGGGGGGANARRNS